MKIETIAQPKVASLSYVVTCLLNKSNIFREDTEDFHTEILRRVRKICYFETSPVFALLGLDVSSKSKTVHSEVLENL